MKTRIFLSIFSCLLFTVLILQACNKDKKDKFHGIDTIDNTLYGAQVYYALGFSFELGEVTSTLEAPLPDITIHVEKDISGNITGKYFSTPNLIESFALAGEYANVAEAQTGFDQLLEVGARSWQLSAMGVEENQVWLFKTSEGNYVKVRTIEIITDDAQNPPFIQIQFEWRMQPGGSTTFSE